MEGDTVKLSHWARRLNELGRRGIPSFFLMNFEGTDMDLWTMDDPNRPDFSFPNQRDKRPIPERTITPRMLVDSFSKKEFRAAFDIVQAGLLRGDSFLTNLTFPVAVQLNCSLEDVYFHAEAKYKVLVPDSFVCFSPETFITIDEAGYVESRPMKGTALDTPKHKAELLGSSKEIAEHATIVDLIRNDLSIVAKRVRVTDYRYFEKISTSRRGLLQTSSKIGGQLPDNWRAALGDTLLALLPAGSVSGAPKPATIDIIRNAEGQPRGYYCGIAGYFDGTSLDTCVMIRFIEQRPDGTHFFRSGGGITAKSAWEDEFNELRAKVRIPLKI